MEFLLKQTRQWWSSVVGGDKVSILPPSLCCIGFWSSANSVVVVVSHLISYTIYLPCLFKTCRYANCFLDNLLIPCCCFFAQCTCQLACHAMCNVFPSIFTYKEQKKLFIGLSNILNLAEDSIIKVKFNMYIVYFTVLLLLNYVEGLSSICRQWFPCKNISSSLACSEFLTQWSMTQIIKVLGWQRS